MTQKQARIATLIEPCRGRGGDARYLAFFHYFNCQQFYEAHEVLEDLWLPQRKAPNGHFYKGLIQLAGAFVHIQKGRVSPARALLALAESNLRPYPPRYNSLDVANVLRLIEKWSARLEPGSSTPSINAENAPQLTLESVAGP